MSSISEFVRKAEEAVNSGSGGVTTANSGPNPMIGIGGAPTRATSLPTGAAERKQYPMATGLLDYFSNALAEVAHVSFVGNEQHNPGQSLRWDRSKSTDEADALMRHFVARGTLDKDGLRHSAKVAWRALALLEKELEAAAAERLPEL